MEEWKLYKLKQFTKNVSRRFDFKKHQNVVFVNTSDVLDGKFLHKNLKKSDELPGQAKKAIIKGDILFSEIRPKNKRYAFVDFDSENYVVSTKFMVIDSNDSVVDKKYFLQLLTSNERLDELQSIAEGRSGTFPQITFDAVANVEFNLPPLQEQIAIASILSALDDKIELNLQMNKTLEEMAMALYKHWFVDFGPFQDGKFVESELGMIPEGWQVVKFGALIDQVIDNRGKTPPLSNVKTNYLLLETYQLSRENLFPKSYQEKKAKYVNEEIFNSKKWFRKGHPKFMDILFATVGNGIPNWSFMYENDGVGIAQNVVAIRAQSNISPAFLRYSFEAKSFLDQFDGYVITTAQPSIKLSDLKMVDMILPAYQELLDWNLLIETQVEQVYMNYKENQTLTTLRDTLLPKLISGKVRVKEFQQLVEASL